MVDGFVLMKIDTTLGDVCGGSKIFAHFLGIEMPPGLFQDFLDWYQDSPI